MINILLRSGIR